MKYRTAQDIRASLRARIVPARAGRLPEGETPSTRSQTAIARQLGVTVVMVNQFLSGHTPNPSPKLLEALGFETQPYWRKKQ